MMKLKLVSCALAVSIFLTGAALPDVSALNDSTPSSSATESFSVLAEPNSDVSSSMPEEIVDSSTSGSAPEDVSEAPIEDSSIPTDEDAVSSEITDESDLASDAPSTIQSENCITEDLAVLLATNQADSMMGNLGLVRSGTCARIVASFTVADYNTENNQDANYAALWADMNTAFHTAADSTAANCVFENGAISILC